MEGQVASSRISENPHTPNLHVQAARRLATMFECIEGVENALVDDWGRHSNFQIALRVEGKRVEIPGKSAIYDLDVDFRSLKPAVRRIVEGTNFILDLNYEDPIVTPKYKTVHRQDPVPDERGHDGDLVMVHVRR